MKLLRREIERLDDRSVPAANWAAAGADAGQPGFARLIDPAGADRLRVAPFGESFSGGVRVAAGDVTGDGVPDLVTGAGFGGGPRVVVYDGATLRPAADFMAFDPTFLGGVNVAAADLNRDGYGDIVVAAGVGGGPRVTAFDGKTGDVLWTQFAFDPSFLGGVSVAAADVDGDERADVVVGAGPGGGPHVKVLSSAGVERRSFFAYEDAFRGGANVAAVDLDADGFSEVVTGAGIGGGPRVRVFDGKTGDETANFFAADAAGRAGVSVAGRFTTGPGANVVAAGGEFYGRTFARVGTADSISAAAGDDAVQVWQATAIQALRATATNPPAASRILAITSAAVYDAVNSILGGHEAYLTAVPDAAGADVNAAVTAAAAKALSTLLPAQASRFDAAKAGQLALVADGAAKDRGVAVGEATAAAILAARADDGSAAVVPYTPGTAVGDWVPTPPANKAALLPGWGNVTPFTADDLTVFRAPDGPAIADAGYTAAFAEVAAVGSKTSTTRTADQTEVALFWAANPGPAPSPPGMWDEIALRLSRQKGLTVAENARMFALLNLALADAAVVCWGEKFADNFWRPVTAIRAAETDGNPETAADADWLPLLNTPNFPSNPSGHSTFSAAAAEVLGSIFGANAGFTASSDEMPGVVRSFASFRAAAAEAGQSRIYGGIHFQFDNQNGLTCGAALGRAVAANLLRPVSG